ncbi:DMT family transporter [Vibrio coralliilyticus OCN008]|uniref:DMT family transporter n=1 Tax=Vibrio coralliilyticus TaxID=190893 RepID=UPI0003911391|nr:DMT family transporter [Vibrio coralliilyticus]ERB66906.1 multidrug transporter [Vibrio coralliilyticus OCN008]QIJ83245.1 DMT family transporter [Vibrio coralliilyticus OCN008]
MTGLSPQAIALWLLIAGNLTASLSDVMVKLLDGSVSPFQYIFIRQLISVAVIYPLWRKETQSARQLRSHSLNIFRAHLVLIGSGCMVVAITHMTLASANAVFYAAPLLMLPISVLMMGEKPSRSKVFGTLVGFVGVLIVLRPSQFHWAAFFALGTASTLALFNVSARKLPEQQSMISTLFWTSLLSLPVAGILAVWSWQPINASQLGLIAAGALLILVYNGLAVLAYRKAPAGEIGLAEYSGLVFVTLFGIWWFNEIPDWITAMGIMLIITPLLPIRRRFRQRVVSS